MHCYGISTNHLVHLLEVNLLLFIINAPTIVEFLKNDFTSTEILIDLCDMLLIWKKITPFLVIISIGDIQENKKKLKTFEVQESIKY